jgi:L-alanine-DL-glutamate epimerase-like enolase superfamily enzyme
MKLTYRNYELKLEYPFGISGYTRTTHDTVLVTIEQDGVKGYGEGSSVRYLGETTETINAFLNKLRLENFNDPDKINEVLDYVDNLAPRNTAAKTAIDLALHDLTGKLRNKPCYQFFGSDPLKMPATTFTIGIDSVEVIREKVRKASSFKMLKIKLGSDHDREIIEAVRAESDAPLSIDANQGWKDRNEAVEMIEWLKEKGVVFIEQPMDKDDRDGNAWVTEHSPLPVLADEAMQRLNDLNAIKGAYSGINIKLMKCTGMR